MLRYYDRVKLELLRLRHLFLNLIIFLVLHLLFQLQLYLTTIIFIMEFLRFM